MILSLLFVSLSVCSGCFSSDTAEWIGLSFCIETEVCPGHHVCILVTTAPGSQKYSFLRTTVLFGSHKSKMVHRRAFFEIDDPQLVLYGIWKNGMLTVICPGVSQGRPNYCAMSKYCVKSCTDQLKVIAVRWNWLTARHSVNVLSYGYLLCFIRHSVNVLSYGYLLCFIRHSVNVLSYGYLLCFIVLLNVHLMHALFRTIHYSSVVFGFPKWWICQTFSSMLHKFYTMNFYDMIELGSYVQFYTVLCVQCNCEIFLLAKCLCPGQ